MSEEWTFRPLVVCAAIRKGERIICGARHFDSVMREQINASEGIAHWRGAEQGFIDQKCQFITREDAWILAEKEGQIRRNVAPEGTLYSENLY